jgi:hypothetical protein
MKIYTIHAKYTTNLGTRWRFVVRLTPRPLYPHILWIIDSVGPKVALDGVAILTPGSTASSYKNYAIPARTDVNTISPRWLFDIAIRMQPLQRRDKH